MGDFRPPKRGIIGAPLAEASVTLTAQLFSVISATVFMIMAPYTMVGKTSLAKKNSGQKKWTGTVEH